MLEVWVYADVANSFLGDDLYKDLSKPCRGVTVDGFVDGHQGLFQRSDLLRVAEHARRDCSIMYMMFVNLRPSCSFSFFSFFLSSIVHHRWVWDEQLQCYKTKKGMPKATAKLPIFFLTVY